MEFRVLGRLEALDQGEELVLGGARQRAVLAVLLLHRREVVPIERLIDELWGERPPPTATQTIRVYVSRLRKTLGDGVLETRGHGYRLAVEPGEVDAEQFDALVAEARAVIDAGDPRMASELLSAALALWRGPPLEEFAYTPFAQGEIARLEEARITAFEDRVDADLKAGRAGELVAELEHLIATHPRRERLTAALMLALYRSGRQADALAAYRTTRRRLVDELGLEPGPALRELERRILDHDSTLTPEAARPRQAASRHHRWRIAASTTVLAVVAAAAAVIIGNSRAQPRLPVITGENALLAINPASDRLVAATRLSGTPGAISSSAGSLWVADPGAEDVSRISAASATSTDRIPVGGGPASIASGGGAIWIASSDDATVTRIDPSTETITQTIRLPGAHLSAIAYGRDAVWVTDSSDDELFEIDPVTDSLDRELSVDLAPSAIAITANGLWVAGYETATVERLDPASGRLLARIHVGDGPAALAVAAGSLWVANSLDSTVSRIDTATGRVVATIPVGSDPTAISYADGTVWVANEYSATVSRIRPRGDRMLASVETVGDPTSLGVSRGRVWATVAADSGSHRGGTLVIATPSSLASSNPLALSAIDPAFYNRANPPQFTALAYDELVTFQQSPGADGLRLVPDLAVSIPTPTDGGRTYRFRIRPGIRYSDGQTVHAEDFRRAFERLFRVGSPGISLFEGLVGAQACTRAPHGCTLARGITVDDATGTVTFHLTAPDPDFLFDMTQGAFCAPIPPGTPDHETDQHTVPGTGPYRIASVSDTRIVFVRNRYFHEWSHAAQPAGNPDSIVWLTFRNALAATTAVEHGRADWLFGQIPLAQYRQLKLSDPSELESNPEFSVDFIPLNTHLAPFNNVLVRRALNYAIDRGKIARLYGGSSFATPTCQLIAPGLPGFRRYCPYTVSSRSDRIWSAPNEKLARRLVDESGTRGERVDVWGEPDQGFVPPTEPAYVAGVLRSLGYRVHLHLVPTASLTEAMHRGFQLSVDGDWVAAYPDASSYIPAFVGCDGGTSNGYYCNPSLDREMQRAESIEIRNPRRASELWASIDRQLTNAAVWVPTENLRDVELTSKRLHNYEYNPVWGFLTDQAWLR